MTRISIEEFKRRSAKPTNNKFGAVKVELDGYTFDSKAESRFYQELKMRLTNSWVSSRVTRLVVHPGYDLGSCYYKADFAFDEWVVDHDAAELSDWQHVVVDIKGRLTRDCSIKIKLMREKYNIDVRVMTQDTDPRLFR